MAEEGGAATSGGEGGEGETKKKKKNRDEIINDMARENYLNTLPERKDRFGNPITSESQFGGGTGDGRRYYPNVSGVGGGYFMTMGQLGKELGHDPEVFARSGGFVGRGTQAAAVSKKLLGGLDLEEEETRLKKKGLLKWPGTITKSS